LCYAKITPVSLQCGEFTFGTGENAEAVGCGPKFQSSGFWRVIAGRGRRIAPARGVASS
jgi:hypothetical protein